MSSNSRTSWMGLCAANHAGPNDLTLDVDLVAIDRENRNPLTRDVRLRSLRRNRRRHRPRICRRSCSFSPCVWRFLRVLTIVTSGGKASRSDFQPFSPLLSRMSSSGSSSTRIYSATRISSMTSRAAFPVVLRVLAISESGYSEQNSVTPIRSSTRTRRASLPSPSIESGSKCTVSGLRMRTKRGTTSNESSLVVRDNAEIPQASFRCAADGGIVCNGCVAAVLDIPNHSLPDFGRLRIRLVINRMDLDARLVDSLVVLDLPDKR